MLTVLTAPTTNDLTRLDTATLELQLSQTDLDGAAAMITRASEICAAYCGRLNDARQSEFGAQTVQQTERLMRPARCIMLDRDINPAITSITEGGLALAASDYELEGRRLYRLSSNARTWWPTATIVITYTTGYALLGGLPHPLEQACLTVMQDLIARRGRDPMLRSESVDGVVSMSYLDPRTGAASVPPQAAELLDPWRSKD